MLLSTLNYESDPDGLVDGEYALDQSVYLSRTSLKLTNNPATALTELGADGGIVGTVQEVPDLNNSRTSRMVFRVTSEAELNEPVQRLLQAQKL